MALAAASALKWWLDFPRPHAVLGAAVHVIGAVELHYSLPSGHATYAALDGAGHNVHLDRPEVCHALLRQWATDLPR